MLCRGSAGKRERDTESKREIGDLVGAERLDEQKKMKDKLEKKLEVVLGDGERTRDLNRGKRKQKQERGRDGR